MYSKIIMMLSWCELIKRTDDTRYIPESPLIAPQSPLNAAISRLKLL